ncbi:MAG TPA: hypothetical protein VL095_09670 [Flavisolibacter sp.]|nr:hypothetical protein [Flavisolibacter sp.]
MKKILLAAIVIASSFTALADGPSQRVLDAFNKTFQNVKEVAWTENEQSFEVKFKQNEILAKVTYDKEGNILKTLRYYYEQNLPLLIFSKVKTKFADKKIFGVTEESSEGGTFYHIVLEDEKHWINITADSFGGIKVDKKFNKA